MTLEYIRKTYNVPAHRGTRVICDGKPGTITGARNAHLAVKLDGQKHRSFWHPTWRIEYLVRVTA